MPIRLFLQRLAGLDARAHADIEVAWLTLSATRAFSRADAALGDTIARSDRTAMRDALAGPLLQIVTRHDDAHSASSELASPERALPEPASPERASPERASPEAAVNGEASTEPDDAPALLSIAEPALAAVLALLVRDVLRAEDFELLYGPFAAVIPLSSLAPTGPERADDQ